VGSEVKGEREDGGGRIVVLECLDSFVYHLGSRFDLGCWDGFNAEIDASSSS
jgi:hypothetical protein